MCQTADNSDNMVPIQQMLYQIFNMYTTSMPHVFGKDGKLWCCALQEMSAITSLVLQLENKNMPRLRFDVML
jgi:hypothetical protein